MVHIGYPKSASTLLQKHLLPQQEEIEFWYNAEIINALSLREHPGGERTRDSVLKKLRQAANASDKPVVISCEHFCMPASWLVTGGKQRQARFSRSEISVLLREYFDVDGILMIVRRQQDFLPSWHQERIKRYETRTLKDLLESEIFLKDVLPALRFDQALIHYEEVFGTGSVSVIPFELLRQDSKTFQRMLYTMLGISGRVIDAPISKSSMSAIGLGMRRHTNKLLNIRKSKNNGTPKFNDLMFRASKRVYSYDWILGRMFGQFSPNYVIPTHAVDAFVESNRKLQPKLDVDLRSLGYLI